MTIAITQIRTVRPFVGGRYGSFEYRDQPAVPDYMHGTLTVRLHIDGKANAHSYLLGDCNAELVLIGKVEVNQ